MIHRTAVDVKVCSGRGPACKFIGHTHSGFPFSARRAGATECPKVSVSIYRQQVKGFHGFAFTWQSTLASASLGAHCSAACSRSVGLSTMSAHRGLQIRGRGRGLVRRKVIRESSWLGTLPEKVLWSVNAVQGAVQVRRCYERRLRQRLAKEWNTQCNCPHDPRFSRRRRHRRMTGPSRFCERARLLVE